MILWPFNRNLLTVFVFITLTSHFFAQGDDCATSLQLNNVSNFCSGAAFYTNAGSTTGTWGNATCFGATTTEEVWFQWGVLEMVEPCQIPPLRFIMEIALPV